MKKLRQLFMACAMLGCSAAAWAQTDVTSSVGTSKDAWGGGGTYGTVTLVNGSSAPMAELYKEGFPAASDTPLKQTISVDNGIYLATMYAHSNFTPDRGFNSSLKDGSTNAAYIYAKSGDVTNKTPIIAYVSTGLPTVNKYDVLIEVADGSLELGLGLVDNNLTNWHTIQIYSLTKYNSLDEVIAPLKEPLKQALEEANSYYTNSEDNNDGTAKAAFKTVIDNAQSTYDQLDTYEKVAAGKEDMVTAIANLKAAYQTYALSGAMPTEGHPFDITFKITNPTFANNNTDGWDLTGGNPKFETFGNAEYYQTNFDISQTITGLPQAYYTLKVKAFQRPGWADAIVPAYVNAEDKADGTFGTTAEIYVNSGSQKIKNSAAAMLTSALNAGGSESKVTVDGTDYYIPNNMNAADKYFAAGYYENEIELICPDGTAKMGFRCTNGTDGGYWTIFDDFRLYLSKPIDTEAYLKVYRNAIAEAQRAKTEHPNVKGKELADIDALIAAEEPTGINEIQAATTKIEEATAAYIAAEAGWTRYITATETATTAEVTYTDISTDATKTAEDAVSAANTLFGSSLDAVKYIFNTEGKTLGFEAGEWTLYLVQPSIVYVNTLLAEDKTVDAEKVAAAEATAIKDAVTAIKGWKANEGEVNALANGNFANNTNIEATGWSKTAWGQSDRSNGTGGYWWSVQPGTIKYGTSDDAAFKLSLKPNSVYYISFRHSKWDNSNADKGGTISILNDNNEGLQETAYTGTDNQKSEKFIFKTGSTQSDYVLTITIPSASRGTFTDFEIKKAVAEDNITINEAEAYTPEAKYANVTLKRTFADGWNGLVLPFDMTIDEAKAKFSATDVKDFDGITTGTEGTTLNFTDATEIKAGKPVMIKTSSTDTEYTIENVWLPGTDLIGVSQEDGDVKYTFTGTYAEEELAGKVFTLINGKFFYNYDGTESTVKAKSFRAYFLNETPKTAAAKSKIIGFNLDGDTTGISEIKAGSKNDGKMFDMQGRRVLSPAKGLYIQNGKKVIVK